MNTDPLTVEDFRARVTSTYESFELKPPCYPGQAVRVRILGTRDELRLACVHCGTAFLAIRIAQKEATP